jgi:hypothetical protein
MEGKEVKEEEAGSGNSSTYSVNYGIDQITKLIYHLDRPLGEVVRATDSGLTQRKFRLDRVNSSSCDCPEKTYVDSNAG